MKIWIHIFFAFLFIFDFTFFYNFALVGNFFAGVLTGAILLIIGLLWSYLGAKR